MLKSSPAGRTQAAPNLGNQLLKILPIALGTFALLNLLVYLAAASSFSSASVTVVPPKPRPGVKELSNVLDQLESANQKIAALEAQLASPHNDKPNAVATTTPSFFDSLTGPVHMLTDDMWSGIDLAKLRRMYDDAFWVTFKTAVRKMSDGHGKTFVLTGDIPDMWIRDSAAQIDPYLKLAGSDVQYADLIEGLLQRQAFYTNQDPYANSFRPQSKPVKNEWERTMRRGNFVATGNYELDSGCYFMRLLYRYWRAFPDKAQESILRHDETLKAIKNLIDMWILEQHHEQKSQYRYPELSRQGRGSETQYTGLTWTGFRPSDDPCKFHYLVPANMFAATELAHIVEMIDALPALWPQDRNDIRTKATKLKEDIAKGIREFAVANVGSYGEVYCYEVDGKGGCNLMDDANVPSLLALPYLDPEALSFDRTIYANTRRMVLSKKNPFYFSGKHAKGIGSPHTPRDHVWPMSLIIQGLTSNDQAERVDLLKTLMATDGGKGKMHESFHVDKPGTYTREWFAWANALFAEFVQDLILRPPPSS